MTKGVDEPEFVGGLEYILNLVEDSSGEKVVSRVSGVPLKDSAPPLDERGEEGLK
jgi:hypothetical protein